MHSRRRATNHLLALVRILSLLAWSGIMYLAYLLWRWPRSRPERLRHTPDWVQFWARRAVWLSGLDVSIQGAPPPRGALICPNHLGYADVLTLAAATPCYFVSRADAASWPLVGRLIRASEQVLVSRRRSRDLAGTSSLIEERLREGQSVAVFLEGTSTGGDRLLRFLPALLQPAIDAGVSVVPVGLIWEATRPGITVSNDIAYWGGHKFPFHFWRLMGLRGCRVTIRWGRPVPACGRDRKELAQEMHSEVAKLVFGSLREPSAGAGPTVSTQEK